jgi:glutamine amidotransferase
VRIGLVDYGAGNAASVAKGLRAVGASVELVHGCDALGGFAALVIPGVGHFGATAALGDAWRRALRARIASVPVLGICLGMQWLFEGSDEAPALPGLGVLAGRCFRLSGPVKVPHVGWNTLSTTEPRSRLLDGVPDGAWAYFTHSYAAPAGRDAVATTTCGATFASCVERGRVWGTQWHPEKSGATGLRVLANFLELVRSNGPSV